MKKKCKNAARFQIIKCVTFCQMVKTGQSQFSTRQDISEFPLMDALFPLLSLAEETTKQAAKKAGQTVFLSRNIILISPLPIPSRNDKTSS